MHDITYRLLANDVQQF